MKFILAIINAMKNFFSFIFFLIFIATLIVGSIYSRDLYRIGEVNRAIVYASHYKDENRLYPLPREFNLEYIIWSTCNTYCYESDGSSYRIIYKLNKFIPINKAVGKPLYDNLGNFTGSYKIRSCLLEKIDCRDEDFYY